MYHEIAFDTIQILVNSKALDNTRINNRYLVIMKNIKLKYTKLKWPWKNNKYLKKKSDKLTHLKYSEDVATKTEHSVRVFPSTKNPDVIGKNWFRK